MELWKSAFQVASAGINSLKTVSQKGIEFAENTAEEAGKRLKGLKIDGFGTSESQTKIPGKEELLAYGITEKFMDFVRLLNFRSFQDFLANEFSDNRCDDISLNAWQVRHALLIVLVVKEVNELRYVLCPRYMEDQAFWAIYFELVKDHLPQLSTWHEGMPLPAAPAVHDASENFMTFNELGGALKNLSMKLQATATSSLQQGVELSTLLHGEKEKEETQDEVEEDSPLLEADPDLEAYLRETDATEGADIDSENLDLEEYLNELAEDREEIEETAHTE